MSSPRIAVTRRSVLKHLSLAASAAALLPASGRANELPHLDPKDPAAVALGYVENAAQADVKKHPTYQQGSSCENCSQLQGTAGALYRPCELFPAKAVAAAGWCSGWSAEI
jgi:hypothetical protein